MYPMYGDMNSHYPYQPPFAHCNFPSWEAFRPQMKEDGANTRPMPEYWPSNNGYPAPMLCQNCCAHGQQPPYYNFRPPCPHFPVPPSYGHYYGGYPATYPQPYPYPNVPHYSMEMPRYEFDKGLPKAFHCCECPNHPSHVKSTSNVKIEEHEPDVETKKAAPVIPAGTSSSPHPLMWVPPGYMMNKEQPRREVEDEPQVKRPKNSIQAEQVPNDRYQWLPLDMNSVKRLMEGGELMKSQEKKDGDEKKASDAEKKDQNKQFSYPIIWMPYGGQVEDQIRGREEKNIGKSPAVEVEDKNKAKLPVETRPPTFKLLEHPGEVLPKVRSESGDDANGASTLEKRKSGNVKIIPVKQLNDPFPKPLKKEQEVELNKNVNNAEPVKNSADRKPSSPTKKSKLPPICLRVDPPKKKNGKGSSRSPSPPGEKRHQASSGLKEEGKDKEATQVMEVAGNAPKGNGVVVPDVTKEEKGSGTQDRESEAEEKVVFSSDSSKLNATVCEDSAVHAQGSPERKVLSEIEAAVILQSAYRGYAVRRFEPLKKLRQIATVKEEASEVSERVEKLESCVVFDDKEKVAIGEMIMNLLLKLDTIQGLHPSVRDVRKSVANELIRLQEKLDSIVNQVSIPMGPHSSTITGVKQEHNASGSNEQSAGSLEIISEASKTSLGEKAAEEASVSEVPLSQTFESPDTDKKELRRESHNEEVVPQIGSSSEYEVSGSCLEKKERLFDETRTPAEDPLMEIQMDLSTGFTDTAGQCRDRDQEGNLDAEAPDENVENEIQRMEWECDLGAVKTDREVERGGADEVSKQIEEQNADIASPVEKYDNDVASALETGKVAEKHGAVVVENDIEIETSANCYKEQEEDQHQPIGKSHVQGDDFEAFHHGNHLTGETFGERNLGAQEFETIEGINYMELVENSMGGKAPFLEPVIEVEKHVLKDGQVTEPPVSESDIGACCKDEDENLNESSQESLEEVEDDICRMEWECDIGAAKFTPGTDWEAVCAKFTPGTDREATQQAESQGLAKQASEVENFETDHIIAESCDENNSDTREAGETIGILKMDPQESESDCSMIVEQGQSVPSIEPVMVVEKQMITELPVSEGVKEEFSLDLSTSPTIAQQYDEQRNRDEANRRIIEENEKLRSMVEQLLASGKDQQNVISTLTAKISALEKKLPRRRNKMRTGKRPRVLLTHNAS